jgi:hypothetical protein
MSLPQFQIAVWRKPHRAYGSFIEIDSDEVDDGLPGGVVQSFKDVPTLNARRSFHTPSSTVA